MVCAGGKVELPLPPDQSQELLNRQQPIKRPSAAAKDFEVVAKPACKMEQVPDGDGRAEVGEFGHISADLVVERQSSVARQKHTGKGGKLLGHWWPMLA